MICKLFRKLFPKKELKSVFIQNPNPTEWSYDELDLLSDINSYRIENGCKPLKIDKLHRELAIDRNIANAELPKISHSGFPVAFKTLIDAGQSWVGENIAYGYTKNESVLKAWIKSKGHKKNILRKDWIYTGISIYLHSNNKKYYCQIFSK